MTSYCTVDDVIAFMANNDLIQLTDDTGSGEMDTAVVMLAVTAASTEIDGYLSARYVLPLAESQVGLLKTLNRDMTVYHLYLRRQGPPEHIEKQYDRAVKLLVRIAEGKLGLGPEDPEPPSAADTPEFESSPVIFGRKNMAGF